MRERYGPKTRQEISQDRIRALYDDGFFDEWRTSKEIAQQINKYIPRWWAEVKAGAVKSAILKSGIPLQKQYKKQLIEWRAGEGRGCRPNNKS